MGYQAGASHGELEDAQGRASEGLRADPRDARTFPQLIHTLHAAYGNDVAIVLEHPSAGCQELTFAELAQHSAELAKALVARGVGKGCRVGLMHGNGPSFVVALAALARVGAIAILISTLAKSDELVRMLRYSDVGGLLVQRRARDRDLLEVLCGALPELRTQRADALRIARVPYLRWVTSSGDDLPNGVTEQQLVLRAGQSVGADLLEEMEAEVHSSDQMLEIYTSGSTALPKGVKHSHGAVLRRTHYLARMLERQRGQVVEATLPMFWVGGLMMNLLSSLQAGAKLVCSDAAAARGRQAFGSIPAAPGAGALVHRPPYWALGMSETLGPYSYGDVLRAPGFPVCAPLDHVAEHYELRIVDDEGRNVGDGELGELHVRGEVVSPGLHKQERSESFTVDGFLRTGDLALRQGERAHFVGRRGDMLKVAGANVAPAEVELELVRLDGVDAAYVVGIADRERGLRLVAALVVQKGALLDPQRVESELRQRLSAYKVPTSYTVLARDEVPLLAGGKVARAALAQLLSMKLGCG